MKSAPGPAWWSYPLAFAVSLVGAYCGAYVKRKAEDRATRESFEALREQLKKTTRDTEEIKATLARKSWLTQQQWNMREKYYMSLLACLTKFRLSLEDRSGYFNEPGSEYDVSLTDGEHYQSLAQIGSQCYQEIRELLGPASVFLSRSAIESIERLLHEQWNIAEFSACAADYVSESLVLVRAAHEAVLREAKSDLQSIPPET